VVKVVHLGRRLNSPARRGSCCNSTSYHCRTQAIEVKQEAAQSKRKVEQLAERLRQLGLNADELDELL
jgi:hypothetical protein